MSNRGSSSKSTDAKLDRLALKGLIPVVLSDEIIDKIKYLCRSFPKLEWSGLLFYSIKGSIRKSEKMEITIQDILLMDVGTGGTTEFIWDEDIVEYRMNKPESMDWIVGHIHSHNTMDVFFSGEDWDELNDNCPRHNIYLSIIVNNYMDMMGKIAFTAERKAFTCKDENGKDYNLSLTESSLNPMMFTYECEFKSNVEELSIPEDFYNRMEEIKKKTEKSKKEEEEKRKSEIVKNPMINLDLYKKNKESKRGVIPDFIPRKVRKEDEYDWTAKEPLATLEGEFAAYVLRLGHEVEADNPEDAMNDIEEALLSPDSMASTICDNYGAYYNEFFEKLKKYHDENAFLSVLEEVIGIYEDNERQYVFLAPIVEGLKKLGNRIENKMEQVALPEEVKGL